MASTLTRKPLTAGLTLIAAILGVVAVLYAAMQAGGTSRNGHLVTEHVNVPSHTLTIYSGRAESLVGDLIQQFRDETGIQVRVKYAATGPLASMILEEDRRTPADVFFAQDPGGLGVLAEADRLAELPAHVQQRVEYEHRDPRGRWIGVTGRLRTIAYSTERLIHVELPESVEQLTDELWKGRIGWAPANASFQAFVTAMRHQHGEAATEQWLRDMIDNGVRTYANNTSIAQAIADGEIDLGLVNHYYAHRINAERNGNFPVANHVPMGDDGRGDIGAAMLISGAAILESSPNHELAERFIEFLLSASAQQYFANETFEYPLANGASPTDGVLTLSSFKSQRVDLNGLGDLRATVTMLRNVGALR